MAWRTLPIRSSRLTPRSRWRTTRRLPYGATRVRVCAHRGTGADVWPRLRAEVLTVTVETSVDGTTWAGWGGFGTRGGKLPRTKRSRNEISFLGGPLPAQTQYVRLEAQVPIRTLRVAYDLRFWVP